jgi:hypothetical protein
MSKNKKVKNTHIKVEHFFINRSMGESYDWKKLDMKKKHLEHLNAIGHSGMFKGKKITIEKYFARHVDTDGIKHSIQWMTANNMEYTDKLIVTRVTVS